jgi:hypothetical protein
MDDNLETLFKITNYNLMIMKKLITQKFGVNLSIIYLII